MTRTNTAIATHHHPRLPVERADVCLLHRVTNDSGAAIAHNLHVELDRTHSFLRADLFHRFEFVIRMRAATDNRDVRWSTDIRKPARHSDRIVMASTRNQNSDRRTPCFIGITVGRNVLTTRRALLISATASCALPQTADAPSLM